MCVSVGPKSQDHWNVRSSLPASLAVVLSVICVPSRTLIIADLMVMKGGRLPTENVPDTVVTPPSSSAAVTLQAKPPLSPQTTVCVSVTSLGWTSGLGSGSGTVAGSLG